MEEYPVTLTNQASDDLTNIYRYITVDLKSPMTADKHLNIFEKAIRSLATFPERCPIVEGLEEEGIIIRKLVVKNYIVFYRFIGDVVTVLRVLHGSSNIESLLREISNKNTD